MAEQQITSFPQSITAHPVEVYREIVHPQISRVTGSRIYTPGPITSGWAFNLTREMADVIALNREFATKFVGNVLLNKQRPVIAQLPNLTIPLDQTHITLPHALGACDFPRNGSSETKRWGEFNYYVVWMMTMMGLEPGLAGAFSIALEKDVDVNIVNDRHGIRTTRVAEVQKVFHNAVRFMSEHRKATSPATAIIALPEPAQDHHEVSVGTEFEAQSATAFGIPLAQFAVNAQNVIEAKSDPDPVWDGPVASWMLSQLANAPAQAESDQLVDVVAYRQMQPW